MRGKKRTELFLRNIANVIKRRVKVIFYNLWLQCLRCFLLLNLLLHLLFFQFMELNENKIRNNGITSAVEFPNVLCRLNDTKFNLPENVWNIWAMKLKWNFIKIISSDHFNKVSAYLLKIGTKVFRRASPRTLCRLDDSTHFESLNTRSLLILFWAFVIVSYLCLTRFNTVINVVDQVPPVMNYDYVVKDLLTFF